MQKKLLKRGDVWFFDPDPTRGREQANKRPCVIISTDSYNQGPAYLAVIIPLTSQFHKISWFVEINPPEAGLKVKSYAICDQIRTISLDRVFGTKIGSVSAETLQKIEQRLRMLLSL